ncbi:MAG: hypothetical protein QOJ19_1736 [Acidimicrobiia bacterium]|nr:hypothetical protein [Acidimicrobiia bacterium]
MTSATIAVVCVADPLTEDELAELVSPPSGMLPGRGVLAFPTSTTAARTMQHFRAQRPFVRAAIDVGEAPVDADGRLVLSGMTAATRALELASAAQSGEVLVSDIGYMLLARSPDLHCEPCAALVGTHRLVPLSQASVPLALPKPLALASRHPFVNRYSPWLALERCWAAVTGGERRSILLEGEAGSGKTRLVTEFARRVTTSGGVVLYGGSTAAVELPFQPFSEALRSAFDQLADTTPGGLISNAARHDLGLLFPWASPTGPSHRPPDESWTAGLPRGPESDRHWAFEAVVDLLVALNGRGPVLFVLDDIHWAQRPTLRLLEHVLRSGRVDRLCVLATTRSTPSDRTDAFSDALSTLVRLPGVERVELERFDEMGVRRFVANVTGTLAETLPRPLEAVVRQLVERSGGNAFLLAESWQHLVDTERVRRENRQWAVGVLHASDTPRSVREMVSHRVARLPDRARRTLEVAACVGMSFDVRIIARAAHEDVDSVLSFAADAVGAGLLAELSPGRFGFVHSLVRQSLEDSLSTIDRARHHLAVAAALHTRGQGEAAILSRHYAAAVPLEPPSTAVRYAREAARRSLQTVSFDDAIAVLHNAFAVADDDLDRADLLVDLAAAYARSGDSAAAARCCQEAADLARDTGDTQRLVRAAQTMSEATWRGALHGAPAAAMLREALAVETDPVARCQLLSALSGALALCGEDDASRQASDAALSLAATLNQPRLLLDAIHSRLYATVLPDNVDDQLALCQRGIEVAVRERDEFSELRLICKAVLRLFVRWDPASLAGYHARIRILVDRFRQPYYLLVHAGNETTFALAEGRFDDAEAAAEQYRTWSEVNHQDDGTYGIQMFSIRREQGRLAELRPMLELAARFGHDSSWAPGLAAVYTEASMGADAAALLDRLASDGLASLPKDSLLPGVLSYLADAAFECRHRGIAQLVLPLLEPYSGLLVYVPGLVCYGAADRYLGRLHSALGDRDAALAAFEAALELDQRTGWTTWIAHSQHALGAHLMTMSRRPDIARGRELLGEALQTASSLGMVALQRRAANLLERLADSPADLPGSLTPREREVLGLLAEGRSNRQIGEALHASQHTIANHVRAILAKTGASNRTEAASWAHRQGGR